jgi:hypothetical protein
VSNEEGTGLSDEQIAELAALVKMSTALAAIFGSPDTTPPDTEAQP